MAAPTTNWAMDKTKVSDKDMSALAKAKALEKKRIKEGWKWVKVHEKLKTLVPFKNGKPTEQGQRMIEKRKELLGIK